MRSKFFYLTFPIIVLTCSVLFAQQKEQAKLSNNEKQFIAAKISKIQADYDKLTQFHKTYESDSIIYPGSRFILHFYDELGRNCFGLNPNNKVQSYDIMTEIVKVEGISQNDFIIFHSFMSDKGKQYFIAVDDSGKVFLIHNFWRDEFNKFILKKFDMVDTKEEALSVIRIYVATKLYCANNREKIIINEDNIKTNKVKFPYLQPLRISGNSKNNFELAFYTYSPYSEEVIFFHFVVTKSGKITFTKIVENKTTITD